MYFDMFLVLQLLLAIVGLFSHAMFRAGNIANYSHNWLDIVGGNDELLRTIVRGVQIPLSSTPEGFEIENHYMPFSHRCFVTAEVSELLQSGAIEVCSVKPRCVSSMKCVPKKGSKLRLILDLRRLNECIVTPSFKYEDVNTVIDQIEQLDELVTIDLKNGFQHVLVDPAFRDLLGFKWNNQYYRYRVLPFGLSCSPYFFCKILRVVANHLRSLQLRVCFYMDDVLLMAKANCMSAHRDELLLTLQRLGWQINMEKSHLTPAHQTNYIGYVLQTDDLGGIPMLRIPVERIRKLKKDIRRLLSQGTASARCIARVAGQCISMAKAVIPAKLLLRNMYRLLSRRTHWEDQLVLDTATQQDLCWWANALDNWNGRNIITRPVELQIATDASQTGWGAHILPENGNPSLQAAGFWDPHMSAAPSNAREMMAVIMAILSFKEQLVNKSIQILTDNVTTATYIMNLGGASPGMSTMVSNLWTICYKLGINLTARYLAGKDNQTADELSRLQPQHEWALHPAVFRKLDNMWGIHTIDRFASLENHLVQRYNSRFWDPHTSGVDALAQGDWQEHNNFINCPFNLINAVLDKLIQTRAEATIIAPLWPGRPWFRRLREMSVATPWRLPKRRGVIWTGGVQPEPLRNLRWQIYAWRVSGRLNCGDLVGRMTL